MKNAEDIKDRKLLIRLQDTQLKAIRPSCLYMAMAKVKKFFISNKWVDLENVIPDKQGDLKPGKLHLDRKFYGKDCTPEAFAQSKRLKHSGGFHCGWAIYREEAADIGEDVYKLMKTATP